MESGSQNCIKTDNKLPFQPTTNSEIAALLDHFSIAICLTDGGLFQRSLLRLSTIQRKFRAPFCSVFDRTCVLKSEILMNVGYRSVGSQKSGWAIFLEALSISLAC